MKLKNLAIMFLFSALPLFYGGSVLAAEGGPPTSIAFDNPLEYETVQEAVGAVLVALQGVIVVLSVVFIVIGAILYITSAGDEKRMTIAKSAITASMIGLAIGVAAPSFLKEIYTIVGPGGGVCDDLTGVAQVKCLEAMEGARNIKDIAMDVLNFLLSLVGVLGIIMLVVGGGMYITAAGDEDRIDTGKKMIKYSIIGIAVALLALVIVRQIAQFFET